MSESPATIIADRLVATFGKKQGHRILDAILDQVPVIDLAALAYDWRSFWARPKQIPPSGEWRTFGFLTARAVGKTTAIAYHIVEEVAEGRARSIGLAAQNEEKTISVQVAALIDASPPWFRPEWIASAKQLIWPNGAKAYALTPEAPGAIRAPNFDLSWLSELQSWPATTRDEAYSNFKFATRVGYARILWDATPKRRHPILRSLLSQSAAEPVKHVVRRGTIHENARNLSKGIIEDLEREFGGTLKGREEMGGEMLDDAESATARQEWIDRARRDMPDTLLRRVISIDPAVTDRKGSDETGIIDAGLGVDGQMLVLGNYTAKYQPHEWAKLVLDLYTRNGCDLVIVETNKGGNLLRTNLNAAAQGRGLRVVVIGKDEHPRRQPGVVSIREIFSRGEKLDRAQPLATAYERGRVSHVRGADLVSLEDTLTTWEAKPGERSPDDLDALVAAAVELLQLASDKPDARTAFLGITQVSEAVHAPSPRHNIPIIVGGDTGGRI